MKSIHALLHQKTSVSLPRKSYRRLCAARKILGRHGIQFSDQEIYRRLFKLFLKNWRGRGRKTNGLRRYNADGKAYAIYPLYVNQVLHAALWQRALHSGESISRILDVAICIYLPRLIEGLLSAPRRAVCSVKSTRYWKCRYELRKRQYPDFFINYACQTQANDTKGLRYLQDTEIISKAGLSPVQIWDLMHRAA